MACRLPGADGLDAFWNLVLEGRTAWGPLPESRFDRDLYFHPEKSRVGKSYSELGAVVPDRPVDPSVCPITPEMLAKYDVAHHVFLEVASLACRDAGLDPFAMPADRRTGVYVGHTGGSTRIGDIVYSTGIDETATLLADVEAARELLGPDVAAVAAELTAAVRDRYPGRVPGEKLDLGALAAAKIVQEALKLDGPYLVVDAACASSLQAMAIGARAILQGGIDQAIVGGASYCKSDSLVLFSAAQSVSNRGSCPFGEAADGLVTAEGYVALVIKTLARAVADGDRIRAVIHGLGVASDGKGKSLWAPRQEGQVLAVERAYPRVEDIGRIEYIEAHATSTQVGDATELGALSRLLARHLPAGRQIPIGSVKANIGHTLETAGMASLVKVVLAMEHGMIPPGSTCTDLNSEFDWTGGPFTVPRSPVSWPKHADGSPRCAAVNAFGIGGLNVHVALAEHLPAAAPPRPAPRRDEPDAIAIVGAGCIVPGAFTLDAFFDLLDRGETAIGPVPPDRWNAARVLDRSGPRAWHTVADQGGFVRGFAYDWRRHKVPPKQIAAANPLQFMLLEAADAAIADAGGPAAGLDRVRTGVVVGTMFGGEFANQLQMGLRLPETGRYLRAALARRGVAAGDADRIVAAYEKKLLEKLPALVDETGSFTSSTLASRLTKTFDLMGCARARLRELLERVGARGRDRHAPRGGVRRRDLRRRTAEHGPHVVRGALARPPARRVAGLGARWPADRRRHSRGGGGGARAQAARRCPRGRQSDPRRDPRRGGGLGPVRGRGAQARRPRGRRVGGPRGRRRGCARGRGRRGERGFARGTRSPRGQLHPPRRREARRRRRGRTHRPRGRRGGRGERGRGDAGRREGLAARHRRHRGRPRGGGPHGVEPSAPDRGGGRRRLSRGGRHGRARRPGRPCRARQRSAGAGGRAAARRARRRPDRAGTVAGRPAGRSSARGRALPGPGLAVHRHVPRPRGGDG
jgi:3-oxoacyl-(acyl-carrier-protein) synthase